MADTVTTSVNLNLECYFVDGDTRTITIKNTGSAATSEKISELNTFMQANNAIIGDKQSGTFGRINRAVKITTTTGKIEIN